jgi:ubiquinone biosynthesis protein Coq4
MKRDYTYFTSGIRQAEAASSNLLSTSKYLNHPGLRDWLVTHYLRRNGPDIPIPSDPVTGLNQALDDLRDVEGLTRLIDAEKEKNPRFREWLIERPYMDLTMEDFARFDPDSFGGIYYRHLADNGYALNLGWGYEKPSNDLEYIRIRSGQLHDFEHLMTGGQFNSLGELLPYYFRMSNPFAHFSPELASGISVQFLLGGHRLVMRAFLHYPQVWPTVLDLMQRGIKIGQTSECTHMMRYEDALHLPIPEAREFLGFRNAEDVDTYEMDLIYTEQVIPGQDQPPMQEAAE